MTKEELKEFQPWYAKTKKPVTINLDIGAISYFKELAEETGIDYQNLMNLYLVQCAREKKRPVFA
ncbi:MAG: antitoxin [Treponema sp.]|nr:antitoxin [Treponema sp.]